MLKQDLLKREKELMNALYNVFDQMGNTPDRTNEEENGLGDMLAFDFNAGLNNDPALAIHYFLPIHDEEADESFFVQSITVVDEIPTEEKKLEMLQAIAVLNFNIPYGSFIFDADLDIISYRYTIPVHESMTREDALKLLTRQVMMGFGFISLYAAPINAFLEDRITWEEYLESLVELMAEVEE